MDSETLAARGRKKFSPETDAYAGSPGGANPPSKLRIGKPDLSLPAGEPPQPP